MQQKFHVLQLLARCFPCLSFYKFDWNCTVCTLLCMPVLTMFTKRSICYLQTIGFLAFRRVNVNAESTLPTESDRWPSGIANEDSSSPIVSAPPSKKRLAPDGSPFGYAGESSGGDSKRPRQLSTSSFSTTSSRTSTGTRNATEVSYLSSRRWLERVVWAFFSAKF